mgnify:CR=1 FL=1
MSWLAADLLKLIGATDKAAAEASIKAQWTRYGAERINIRQLSNAMGGPTYGANLCAGPITYLIFSVNVGGVQDTGSDTVPYTVSRSGRSQSCIGWGITHAAYPLPYRKQAASHPRADVLPISAFACISSLPISHHRGLLSDVGIISTCQHCKYTFQASHSSNP